MRKWTALLAALLVVALTAPAVAAPPEGKGKPPADPKESCWDIKNNHGATAWNLASEEQWPYDVDYPLVAEAPACFDLPETPGEWTVAWEIDNGEVKGILLSFRSEIYADTTCVRHEILDPASSGSVVLTVGSSCASTIHDGYVLMGMTDVRIKGKKPGDTTVTFTVTAPVG